MKTKVVINRSYTPFRLSEAAMRRYAELKGIPIYVEDGLFPDYWVVSEENRIGYLDDISDLKKATILERARSNRIKREGTITDTDFDRTDPFLVQTIEELGDTAHADGGKIRIMEVDKGTIYRINDYNEGFEDIIEAEYGHNWRTA